MKTIIRDIRPLKDQLRCLIHEMKDEIGMPAFFHALVERGDELLLFRAKITNAISKSGARLGRRNTFGKESRTQPGGIGRHHQTEHTEFLRRLVVLGRSEASLAQRAARDLFSERAHLVILNRLRIKQLYDAHEAHDVDM